MKCEVAQDQIVLMGYGELPDELADNLEQHLAAGETRHSFQNPVRQNHRHCRAVAAAIPGARFVVLDGMGHDLPDATWVQIIDAIVANAASGLASGQPA